MSSNFRQALQIIRDASANSTELGTAFERLVKVFLENDATQTQQYEKVWFYSDWAAGRKGYAGNDIGIDLVAKLRGHEGYCAIQCKFYDDEHTISKQDLDSFISASASSDFVRLLLVDTSAQDIGKNAQAVFDNLDKEYIRIPTNELEESRIDWLTFVRDNRVRLASKKDLRDHQKLALKAVKDGLAEADRGKLIMACGTGKTFTSLRIAEEIAGAGKRVLYMVPSLALMSQTVREWKNDAVEDFTAFSACSDVKVGKRQDSDDQTVLSLHDLAFPATTEAQKLAEQVIKADASKMTVVFSTYQSIDVISRAQFDHGLPEFDFIICDEAHRTTGATLVGDDESNFVRIHSDDNVRGKKRLYMTATHCFPLNLYEASKGDERHDDLFSASSSDTRLGSEHGISDQALSSFQSKYNCNEITKDDLFYYIYGLLSSADYRERFADSLSKLLPRIPAVKSLDDFWVFSRAGKELGDLHVSYETADPYPVIFKQGDLRLASITDPVSFFRVEQMRFGSKGDKSTVVYNPNITIVDIPLEAYDYVVNGKSALEWIMERQSVRSDKASGIVNDANDFANETMHNSRYPLELFCRVITVSLETVKIVNRLPKLDID